LLQLAYSSVRQRVADALLLLRDKYQEEGSNEFSMNISRDDLANIVGTATESLIRSLSELKTEGILRIKGSKIQILLPEKLERIATKGF
jgi:CRP-like cAMP-binding protein